MQFQTREGLVNLIKEGKRGGEKENKLLGCVQRSTKSEIKKRMRHNELWLMLNVYISQKYKSNGSI